MSYGDLNFCHRFGSANLANFLSPLPHGRCPIGIDCPYGKAAQKVCNGQTTPRSLQSCRPLKALQKAAPSDDVRHTEGARVVR
jgi:hypothetical protein